ncbi:hypothetical protein GCM10022206_87150 [Streptomyces chiangmaiensis]
MDGMCAAAQDASVLCGRLSPRRFTGCRRGRPYEVLDLAVALPPGDRRPPLVAYPSTTYGAALGGVSMTQSSVVDLEASGVCHAGLDGPACRRIIDRFD